MTGSGPLSASACPGGRTLYDQCDRRCRLGVVQRAGCSPWGSVPPKRSTASRSTGRTACGRPWNPRQQIRLRNSSNKGASGEAATPSSRTLACRARITRQWNGRLSLAPETRDVALDLVRQLIQSMGRRCPCVRRRPAIRNRSRVHSAPSIRAAVSARCWRLLRRPRSASPAPARSSALSRLPADLLFPAPAILCGCRSEPWSRCPSSSDERQDPAAAGLGASCSGLERSGQRRRRTFRDGAPSVGNAGEAMRLAAGKRR